MALLDTALSVGLNADYVLFDSWFSNPVQITAIHSKGMDVIAMIKKSSRIKYSYGGKQLSIKEIYSKNKKRHGRSKYLLSVDVMVGKETPIPAKIVCVRNKSNRKDWLAFICTDTTLSEEEIIRVYGKRWQIEVFFKTCKSMLNLIGECHSLSYDALTAHVALYLLDICCLQWNSAKTKIRELLVSYSSFSLMKWQTLLSAGHFAS